MAEASRIWFPAAPTILVEKVDLFWNTVLGVTRCTRTRISWHGRSPRKRRKEVIPLNLSKYHGTPRYNIEFGKERRDVDKKSRMQNKSYSIEPTNGCWFGFCPEKGWAIFKRPLPIWVEHLITLPPHIRFVSTEASVEYVFLFVFTKLVI